MLIKTLSAAGLAIATATPLDWTGSYPDNFYGGEYKICVTERNGVYYGQALHSKVGYMRGTIDSGTNVWTGNYFLAGIEGRRGTFSFSLSADTFTGTFTENSGAVETVTGTRTSSTEPTDLECFRAEPELLDGSESFSFGGYWIDKADRFIYVDANDVITGSFNYGEGLSIPGWCHGYVRENGQVAQLQWYEEGEYEGMYMFAGKNASAQYILWWGFDWISEFDYSREGQDHWADTGSGTRIDFKGGNEMDYDLANQNRCYQLITESFESECLETTSAEDDDIKTVETLLIPTLTFSLIGMVAGLVACGKSLLSGSSSTPMSENSDAKL